MVIGDYTITTQYVGDYNSPIGESLSTNQYTGMREEFSAQGLSVVELTPLKLGGMSTSGLSRLDLEPSWQSVHAGDIVDIQADLILFDKHGSRHLFKSILAKRFFTFQGVLTNQPAFSFLRCQVVTAGDKIHIDATNGYCLGHSIPTHDMHNSAMETCSGIGMLGGGLRSCGLTV